MSTTYSRALVTGASSGIGEAFARALAARGTSLVLVARRAERLHDLAGALRDRHGVPVEVLPADLTDDVGLHAVAARVRAEHESVDLLVNNAGFGTSGALVEIPAERVDEEIRLNVVAVAHLTRAALPGMVARRHGAVVNVSSVVSFQAMPHIATYGATKAFVTSFTEGVAEEVRDAGVRVQALCPGFTRTEFQHVAGYADGAAAPSFLFQDAAEVVRASLDGLERGRVVVVPGLHNKAMVTGSALTPRAAKRRLIATVQRVRAR